MIGSDTAGAKQATIRTRAGVRYPSVANYVSERRRRKLGEVCCLKVTVNERTAARRAALPHANTRKRQVGRLGAVQTTCPVTAKHLSEW